MQSFCKSGRVNVLYGSSGRNRCSVSEGKGRLEVGWGVDIRSQHQTTLPGQVRKAKLTFQNSRCDLAGSDGVDVGEIGERFSYNLISINHSPLTVHLALDTKIRTKINTETRHQVMC